MSGHEDAWGLGHLGLALDTDSLGVRITKVPLLDQEREDSREALRFAALMVEGGNPRVATRLRRTADMYEDATADTTALFDTPLAARFLQVRRERDEATRLLFEAHEMLAALADRFEALTGEQVT